MRSTVRLPIPVHDRQRTSRPLVLVALALLLTLSVAEMAIGATFYPLDYHARNDPAVLDFAPVCNAELHGTIHPGDAERVQQQAREYFSRVAVVDLQPRNPVLCLSSPGGDIAEAIKLHGLFARWTKVVEADQACISACAMLFMLTPPRTTLQVYAADEPGRFLHYRGRVGFHAPRLEVPSTGPVTVDQVQIAYEKALQTIRNAAFPTRAVIDDVLASLPALNLPPLSADEERDTYLLVEPDRTIPIGVLLAFLTIPPDRVLYVETVAQAIDWGIEVYGFAPPAALTDRLLTIGCLNTVQLRCAVANRLDCPGFSFPYQTERTLVPPRRWLTHDVPRSGAQTRTSGRTAPLVSLDLRKAQIWPPLSVDAADMAPIYRERQTITATISLRHSGLFDAKPFCDFYATREAGRVTEIVLHAHAGSPIRSEFYRTPAEFERLQDELIKAEAKDRATKLEDYEDRALGATLVLQEHSINYLRLLPPGRRLADLGDTPWATLDDGPDLFSLPMGDYPVAPLPQAASTGK